MAPRKLALGLAIVAAALAVSVAGDDSLYGQSSMSVKGGAYNEQGYGNDGYNAMGFDINGHDAEGRTQADPDAGYKHAPNNVADGKAIEITAQNDSTEDAPVPSSEVESANSEQVVNSENAVMEEPSAVIENPPAETTQPSTEPQPSEPALVSGEASDAAPTTQTAQVSSVIPGAQKPEDDPLHGTSRMAVRGNGFDSDGYDNRGYSAFGFDAKGLDEKGRNAFDPDSGSGRWLVTAKGMANVPTAVAGEDTQNSEPTPAAEETKPQEENANENVEPSAAEQPNTDTSQADTPAPEPLPNTGSAVVAPTNEIEQPDMDEPAPSPSSDTPPPAVVSPSDAPVPNPAPATNPKLYGESYMAMRGQGFDSDGYDTQGYDAMGFNQTGVDRQGRSRLNPQAGKTTDTVTAGGMANTPTETSAPIETADRGEPSPIKTPDREEPKEPTNIESKPPPAAETTVEPVAPETTEPGQQPGPFTTDPAPVPAVSPVDTSAPEWDDLYGVAMMGVRGQGYDADGFNTDGFDIMGYTRKGYDKWGRHKTTPESGLVPPGSNTDTPTDGKANTPKHTPPPPPPPAKKTTPAKSRPRPTPNDIKKPLATKRVNPVTSSTQPPKPEPTNIVYPCGRAEHCGKYDTVCVDYAPVCKRGKCKKGYYNSGVLPYSQCIDQSEVIVGGRSVAISGDGTVMVEGLPESIDDKRMEKGQAAVYRKSNGQWKQVQSLLPSDTQSADWFGVSVDICGDGSTIVVGSWLDSVDKRYAGSVYIFTYDQRKGEYRQHVKIVAPDGKGFDYFGQEVKISFDCSTVVVGAYGRDEPAADNSGAAYVFKARAGGRKFTYAQTLREKNPVKNRMLGQSLAVNGDGSRIFVGGQHSGMVLYWECYEGKWLYKQTISSNIGADGFGHSIDTNWAGDALAVGVPGDNYVAIYRANSDGIYKIDNNGRVILPEGHRYGKAKFGFSVSLNNNYGVKDTATDSSFLLVGAPDQAINSIAGAGAAYVYQFQSWSDGWAYVDLSFNGGISKPHFGHAVALDSSGDTAAITDGRGKVSMYSWTLE